MDYAGFALAGVVVGFSIGFMIASVMAYSRSEDIHKEHKKALSEAYIKGFNKAIDLGNEKYPIEGAD